MDRVKWFEVDWSSNYDNVSSNIISNKLSDSKQYGFKVYKRRENFIHASYIEIKEVEEEVENPLTNELTVYKRVLFDKNDFAIENNNFGIELINPSRTFQHLINTIASFSNFNITIKALNYNLSKLIQVLNYKLDNLTINQIECSNIKITGLTSAKLTAKNDKSDIFCDVKEFLNDKEYIIEKVKCSFHYENQILKFELSNHGSLKAKRNVIEYLSPIIKKSILDIKQ